MRVAPWLPLGTLDPAGVIEEGGEEPMGRCVCAFLSLLACLEGGMSRPRGQWSGSGSALEGGVSTCGMNCVTLLYSGGSTSKRVHSNHLSRRRMSAVSEMSKSSSSQLAELAGSSSTSTRRRSYEVATE
eukprot:scaffold48181_cov63-Phaeocystis_antarctica.AAC.7